MYILNRKNKTNMRKKYVVLLILFNLLLYATVFSQATSQTVQGITITGTVRDGNGALPGVRIVVKGTTQGVTSDANGKFVITVPERDAVLAFSIIGYSEFVIEP